MQRIQFDNDLTFFEGMMVFCWLVILTMGFGMFLWGGIKASVGILDFIYQKLVSL